MNTEQEISDSEKNETFAEWELRLADIKARGLINRYGLTHEDFPDLKQDLLVEIYVKRKIVRLWKIRTASDETIMDRILDNWIRSRVEWMQADKRRAHYMCRSLDQPVMSDGEDECVTFADLLKEDDGLYRKGRIRCDAENEMRLTLLPFFKFLNPVQCGAIRLMQRGYNISQVARTLSMSRSSLRREIYRIREIYQQRGLRDAV